MFENSLNNIWIKQRNSFFNHRKLDGCVAVFCRNIRYLTFSKTVNMKINASSPKPSMTNSLLQAQHIYLFLSQHNHNINSIFTKVLHFWPWGEFTVIYDDSFRLLFLTRPRPVLMLTPPNLNGYWIMVSLTCMSSFISKFWWGGESQ